MIREVASEVYSVPDFSRREMHQLHHPPHHPHHSEPQFLVSSLKGQCTPFAYSNIQSVLQTKNSENDDDDNLNTNLYNLHNNRHLSSNQPSQIMKNVHFSPVVSQLRYPPADHKCRSHLPQCHPKYGDISSENGGGGGDDIRRVKVQVQQIEKPVQHRVQRIQVSVPHHDGQGLEKVAVDLSDIVRNDMIRQCHLNYQDSRFPPTSSSPPPLFLSRIKEEQSNGNGVTPDHLQTTTTKHFVFQGYPNQDDYDQPRYLDELDRLFRTGGNSHETTPPTPTLSINDNRSDTLPNSLCGSHVKPIEFKGNSRAFESSRMPPDVNTNAQMHQNKICDEEVVVVDVDVVKVDSKINNFENALSNHNVTVCEVPSKNNSIRNANVGSLEFLESEEVPTTSEGSNRRGKTKILTDKKSGESKNKGVSSSNSWPSAYRKTKEKKPKLNFLQRITFGRFGNGGNNSNSKKSKRSSCPPLGHPILLTGAGNGAGGDGIDEDKILMNDLNSEIPGKKSFIEEGESGGTSLEIHVVNDCINVKNPSNFGFEDEKWNSKRIEEHNVLENYLQPSGINVTSDLPPKPYPRNRRSPQSSRCQDRIRLIPTERHDADELSVKFEQILEGILDLECVVMDGKENRSCNLHQELLEVVEPDMGEKDTCAFSRADEEKNSIPLLEMEGETTVNTFVVGTHQNSTSTSQVIPVEVSIPVVGKPPKPPSSANRLLGMRTGASERFSYLRGRMNATAATETRLAMELAAKLSEFREELHRSREEIAKSQPNLDEIENSVRISMAIDRSQRTLPHGRNLTKCSLPPVLLKNENVGSKSTSSSSADEPVKPVTEIIREEWESVVLRAKENLRPSQHLNNGNSNPLESRGIVLETDLDTGASREFPVDVFSHGDEIRRRDLEKVLKVEEFTSSLIQRNSCSLQNLAFVPIIEMATLTPGEPASKEDRSRSMEFLVDDKNKNAHLMPPENTLMKNQETRRMSEHELRIQRSLQKLNVPDWYKNYAPGSASASASAANTPSKSREFGSGTGLAGGWPGLSTSKTSSLTSLQSAGRYTGSRSGFGSGRHRSTGTASTGGRSSRESLMSPSSTASASPSPYFERSSFTYGMPYALTRFAAARMSCGASPASLSPSPSPVGGIGSSTSTPVSSGPAAVRYGYQKQPYLGWRSQERLTNKTLYRSPAERLAADLIAQKAKPTTPVVELPPPEIEIKTSPKKETASSDLSLNNSEESNSHKLNRVRSSIKEVSNAIVDYVNETKPLDDGMNGRASPRRGLVWLESSFVGTKPIDSPGTPDTPSTFMSHRGSRKDPTFRFDESAERSKDAELKSGESSSTSHYTSYISRNEQMEERSNSSSVSSPTLEDILDSLLALRRPNKKFRSRGKGHETTSKPAGAIAVVEPLATDVHFSSTFEEYRPQPPPSSQSQTPSHRQHQPHQFEPSSATSEICSTISSSMRHRYQSGTPSSSITTTDWQERMNQPLSDSHFISGEPETFTLTGSRTGTRDGGGGSGGSIGFSTTTTSATPSNSTISFDRSQQWDKYSVSSSSGGVGVNESVSSSTSNIIHSATSSMHSTPTHQQYHHHNQPHHYQQQQHNQPSSVVASSRDYSSCSSSPAKSCLESSSTPTQRDDNELRQSLLRDEEELAFGNPTEIRSTVTSSTVAPITGGVIINPLTGLSEYSNPPTPARHRRVSFDLDFSDKEEKSSSRSRNKDENVGGTIQCRNTKCGKTATGLEARREFKVCHNCNAYYCSRECRRAHWEKHKKVCMQSRVGAICKQIISHVKEDSYVMNQLSTVAKRGYLAKGRGCVKLFFNSPDRAERFLTGGLPELPEPLYIPHADMLPEEMGAQTFSELSDQCRSYNPETRLVLYACVCVVNEVPTYGAVKWERELISRSSKLRLLLPRNFYEEVQRHHHAPANPAHLMSALQDPASGGSSPGGLQPQQQHVPLYDSVTPSAPSGEEFPPPLPPHQTTNSTSENETLILRSVPPPTSHQLSSSEHKRLREVSFTNIQKHLLQRGVDLKRTYPDIFMKLCRYVEQDEPFLPVTIYPKNTQTGRQFVCIIMPESSDSAYTAATQESGQGHPLQRVETINISEQDEQDIT